MSADVVDSPDRSVAEHVNRYVATDGRDGYLEGGVPNLVLTVTGLAPVNHTYAELSPRTIPVVVLERRLEWTGEGLGP